MNTAPATEARRNESIGERSQLPDPGDPNALYLVDLNCWGYRNWSTVGGACAHATMRMLMDAMRYVDTAPGHFIVCADVRGGTWRHELAPKTYKAHRPAPDATLLERLRWMHEMTVDGLGVPLRAVKGYEADDLIATLARQGVEDGMQVVILAIDKDLMQLVGDNCVMWDGKGTVIGRREVEQKFGVRCDQVGDYLAIVGDAADGIAGVPGMGPKAALELLQGFGSLREALAVAASSYEHPYFLHHRRHRTLLREHRKTVELAMKLVALAFDAPVSIHEADR